MVSRAAVRARQSKTFKTGPPKKAAKPKVRSKRKMP